MARTRRKGMAALLVLLALAWGLSASFGGGAEIRRVAAVEDLLTYPQGATGETPGEEALYGVALPETDLLVVLRPLSKGEYFGYQVRAYSIDLIEQEMLAAAIVLPKLGVADVGGLSPDLVAFLRSRVNEISGFGVFLEFPSGGAPG